MVAQNREQMGYEKQENDFHLIFNTIFSSGIRLLR